ncbi:MAG: YihY/virulence factor BrkB family protein [Gemmatimonadales bacterium]
MPQRSLLVDLGWTLRDYAKRVWDNSGEDNVLFLAGGIAFNIILAALPFILLLATGVTYLLPIFYRGEINSTQQVGQLLDHLLPAHAEAGSPYHKLINDLLRTRRSLSFYSGLGFIWFSTRLFGSLRTVLASVFDIETERGIIAGKIFDVKITVVSTVLFAASVTVTTYVGLASSALVTIGLRNDVIPRVQYWAGRSLGFVFLVLMFFALYKYLPIRRVPAKAAWVAAAFTSVCFEAARTAFSYYTKTFNPASMYSGTLTAIVVVVVWCYYAALIFILGGEVGQVFELRRVRRLQREVFTE